MKDISELIILTAIGCMTIFGSSSDHLVKKAELNSYVLDSSKAIPVNIDSIKKSIDTNFDTLINKKNKTIFVKK